MKYHTVTNAVLKKHSNKYFESESEGDQAAELLDIIDFNAKHYPLGTVIRLEVPECPKCGLPADYQDANGKCDCGFDWEEWALENDLSE